MTKKRGSSIDINSNGRVHHNLELVSLNEQAKVANTTVIQTTRLLKPVTANHKAYIHSIQDKDITICIGPSGTAKTSHALYTACKLYNQSKIKEIIYVRSLVGMDTFENEVGTLPGELSDRLAPYLYPVIDSLSSFMAKNKAEALIRDGIITVSPMSLLRGRSFGEGTLILADEMQNAPISALKTLVTRLATGGKMVIAGDVQQIDLNYKLNSGLAQLAFKLSDIDEVGVVYMNRDDIVRSGLVGKILDRLEEDDY